MSLESGFVQKLIVPHPGGTLELAMETWEGGNVTRPDTKHRSAVTDRKTARGGKADRENLTVTREVDAEMWAAKSILDACRTTVTAIRQRLNDDGTIDPSYRETITGKFANVKYPQSNIDGEDVGMVEIEIVCDE